MNERKAPEELSRSEERAWLDGFDSGILSQPPAASQTNAQGAPVAYRAWFDQDHGARWLFTLWPEEERLLDVTWEPLYATQPPAASQPSNTELEAFEAWARSHLGQGYPLDRDEGVYIYAVPRWAFRAWKAGRAAIAVQPPAASQSIDEQFFAAWNEWSHIDSSFDDFQAGWVKAIDAAKAPAVPTPLEPLRALLDATMTLMTDETCAPEQVGIWERASESLAATQPPAASQPIGYLHNQGNFYPVGAAFDPASQPPAASQPSDTVTVPLEPTDAMMQAGKNAVHESNGALKKALSVYRAMVLAAVQEKK